MNKVFIVNVGVNASHGSLRSPIFSDGTFEFVPIPERGRRVSCPQCSTLPCYKDLKSQNDTSLLELIPKRYHNLRVHNDPEFATFTYGDYPTFSPRAANLKKASSGDFLFFLARLVKYADNTFYEGGFFLIGFLEIESILQTTKSRPEAPRIAAFRNNAHVQRAIFDPQFWNGFWVFKGSPRSRRFLHAIPFDKQFCEKTLTDSKGERLAWSKNRSELQVIGSCTRSCRIIEKGEQQTALWKLIENKSNVDRKRFSNGC